jgi:hypothetical protein
VRTTIEMERQLASLDLTHVLCESPSEPGALCGSLTYFLLSTDDANSHLSLGLALMTLSPILLMASYTSLAVFTRELTILIMLAGQLLCEASNYVLKHSFKQPRPNGSSCVPDPTKSNRGANRSSFYVGRRYG